MNTGGRELRLAGLRGRFVLLDFWTFCCVNCLHVLDELRPLEEKYGDALVTVGVHSPKFPHEADPEALVAAVERYDVRHPVLDDPELLTWKQYAARAWPTLALIDPEGYLVATAAGEGHVEGFDALLGELVAEHERRGTLRRGDGPYAPPPPAATALRFPGKVLALPTGTLLVSDSARHSLVELAADGETVLRRIGTGERGLVDGGPDVARFSEPQGLALLPDDDVVVADTVNHALRLVRLADGTVSTLVRSDQPLSPWDLAWCGDAVVVAAAGTHQLWRYDPGTGAFGVLAGTTVEGLKDGPAAEAWMAQPSGLATSADGSRLWIADAETSALRYLEAGELHTVAGQGLFDFGHRDGPAAEALFQHPLGVAVLADGSVAVCDTYNNAVRRYDPAVGEVTTLATEVAEPSGAAVLDGELVVVESAAHRLSRPVAPGVSRQFAGPAQRVVRPPTELAAGEVTLDVVFTPPPGQKLDDQYGPPTRVEVSATPPALVLAGGGSATDLSRTLRLNPDLTAGVLHVTAQAAVCDVDDEHAACHLIRQDWGVPVRIVSGGPSRLGLVLRGLDG